MGCWMLAGQELLHLWNQMLWVWGLFPLCQTQNCPEILLPMSEAGGKSAEQGCPLALRGVPWPTEGSLGPPGCPWALGVSLWSRERQRERAGKGLGRTGPVPAVAAAR